MLPFWIAASSAPPPHGAPGVARPDRHWDLVHYELDLALEPTVGRISGSASLKVRPLLPQVATMRLDQVGLDIERVDIDGAEGAFRTDDTSLFIELDPTSEHTVVVHYAAEPETGLHFRGPGRDSSDTYTEVWSQGEGQDNRHWLPIWDHPSDRFTYRGRFTAPDDMKVLSNGVGSQQPDGSWVYELLDQDLVAYLIMVAAGPYQVVDVPGGPVPIAWWIPPDAEPKHAENAAGNLPRMMEFFGTKTGLAYPYPAYREVYVQRFLYTGMENTSSTVMHRRVLIPNELVDTRIGSQRVVAHELAHQWFGDTLTCDTWNELWLNEGFATFFAAEWMRQVEGEDAFYSGVAGRMDGAHTAPLAGRFWSTEGGDHAVSYNVYTKGSSVLQSLRVLVGEEAFWASIQRYVAQHQHGLVETDDLRRAFEAETGLHLRWFFDQWAHLPGGADVSAVQRYADGELSVTLKQDGDTLRALPVDIEIGTADGPIRRRVWLDDASARLVLELDEAPTYVALDPDAGLIAHIEVEQSAAMWRAQADNSSPYARIRALDALAEQGDDDTTAFLVAMATGDESLTMRKKAIAALESRDEVTDTLIDLLGDPEAIIRRAAVATLEASNDPQAGNALKRHLAREDHPDVRARTLRALRRHLPDAARREALGVLRRRTGWHNPLHKAALDVLAKEGTRADLAMVVDRLDPETSVDLLHAAIWSAAGIIERLPASQRDDARKLVAPHVEPLLRSAHLRTRQTAIQGLGQLGTDSSVRHLQTYAKLTRLEGEAERATGAIRSIRSRRDVDQSSEAALEARLLEIEETLEAHRKAMEDLEGRH
ncbi:MAG: M1 family metallopeptidase [Proteobacteria bacterium]|nr:M1 family metallopeptidase [Pseudomonadota bacterium]MCP4919832.1 M1 family metallopeptidase [Pseudomonadota bacterium]